jgi:hypothetical protein
MDSGQRSDASRGRKRKGKGEDRGRKQGAIIGDVYWEKNWCQKQPGECVANRGRAGRKEGKEIKRSVSELANAAQ